LIAILCLNAGIDRTYEVAQLTPGALHRPERVRMNAGGKGINVARVAARLGQEVVVSGFAGGSGATFIAGYLRREGILADFVDIGEESRVCINIIDRERRTQTQVDEAGPLVTPSEVDKLRAKWPLLLAKSQLAVISGSAPRGVPHSLYRELVATARRGNVPCILDARGEMLREGIEGRPQMIKPNVQELAELVGRELPTAEDIAQAARGVVERGVQIVLVSTGARGAIAATRSHGTWLARPPAIEYVSAVGSGDAMVGAFAALLAQQRPLRDCLRWATAAGAANAATFGPAFCTREEIERLVPGVETMRVDALETLQAQWAAPRTRQETMTAPGSNGDATASQQT